MCSLVGLEHEEVRDLVTLEVRPSQYYKRGWTYAEVPLLTKPFTASRMLAGLYPQVLVVMTSAVEEARVTYIGSFPSVDSTMDVEVSLLRESL